MRTDDFNSRDHWSKTKKGRATACRALGFESSITQSARQLHQPASETVLDNAFSAIIGAVWLDCEARGMTAADTRRTVWNVLRELDAILESLPFMSSEGRILQSMSNASITMLGDSVERSDMTDLLNWLPQGLSDLPCGELSYENHIIEPQGLTIQASVEADRILPPEGCVFGSLGENAITMSGQGISACVDLGTEFEDILSPSHFDSYGRSVLFSAETLENVESNAATSATCAKRKRTEDSREMSNPTYHRVLDLEQHKLERISQNEREKLERYLDHPDISQLDKDPSVLFHFLYLAIGSWQTIHDFKDQLRLARNFSDFHKQSTTSRLTPSQTYNEICRLEKEESLNVLLRRYHTILLCQNEQERDSPCSNMTVETPITVGVARRLNAGNPLLALDAELTNRLLYKIMPDVQPGTNDFKKARRKVKRLRKLARYLDILVQSYGLGILALLPSGPSFEEASLNDNL